VESRHFRPGWLTPREVGFRAVTAALSDLAAMAAQPLGILLAVGLPARWRGELEAIAEGVGEAVEAAGTVILGGNLVAAEQLTLTTTVLGSCFAPLRRSGARPGDRIYVTGELGGPAAAITAWEGGLVPAAQHRQRFVHPAARITEARWLADHGVHAAIDVSDGFASDLEHLLLASGVGAEVDLSRLPLAAGLQDHLSAAGGGEEFELIVTSPTDIDADAFERQFALPLSEVGRVGGAAGEIVFRLRGERVAKPAGYDHLSR
jgi:thiamine-monophosphate kinase